MPLTRTLPTVWTGSHDKTLVILADVPESFSFLIADKPCIVIDAKLEDYERDLDYWELAFRVELVQ
jgi:hypothetical protein